MRWMLHAGFMMMQMMVRDGLEEEGGQVAIVQGGVTIGQLSNVQDVRMSPHLCPSRHSAIYSHHS